MKSDSFVSIVVVVQQHLANVSSQLLSVAEQLESHFTDYEVVVIVSGLSSTNASTEDNILKKIPCVRIIQLSNHVFMDVAQAAGLENAIGDFVVLWNIDADPINIIPALVEQCQSGQDVVIGVTTSPRRGSYALMRKVMNGVLHTIDYDIPTNSTSLRCLSRRAVNAITRTGRFHHQLYLRIQKTGYVAGSFYYLPHREDEGMSMALSVRRLLRLLVFNSSRPLRWMSMLGFTGSMAGFIFAMYSILVHLINGNVVEGWTTIVLFMSLLFVIQFIMLAFFGEYLGRLLDESSSQAEYSIVYERNSDVMVNADRINVLNDSMPSESNFVQTGRNN